MKIEHVALWVQDIEKVRAFYENYFDVKSSAKYTNSVKKFSSYFLSFGTGARLEIMQMDSIQESPSPASCNYFGFSHIAISTGTRENVDRLTDTLIKDGFTLVDGPRVTGDGYYESVILDPEGNRLEITI